MKHDMNLIRNILRSVDANEDKDAISGIQIDGHSHQEIAYHVMLLNEAEIIRADMQCDEGSNIPEGYEIYAITREGYAFLDAFSDDRLWKKANTMIGDIGEAPIHLVIPLFMELIKARII
ncbi:DUF2513 domain-containing protein [Methanogenium sp. MK-MG]|uniref:DUF2513 domain-containing protein n=1 Tax=Methanogenium sp. MK-MG TaxID=2599926 RepID=UPI0013E9D336|nr:DUF2513 domain-containing protein [Methanogenium sp. MK-MG]KAF1078036.1 hypothetical protein MKMG_01078 [Methanogenium sp. MK-MG]